VQPADDPAPGRDGDSETAGEGTLR
jgi:hypothetical protein